jgi:hypothetical protein
MRRNAFRPSLEGLEERIVPYSLTGYKWPNLNVSVSYMPDGTKMAWGTESSNLFVSYDAKSPTASWQYQFARALETWASVTPLNFHIVSDNGAPEGATGPSQGDPNFGDIRLGAYASTSFWLGFTYPPSPYGTSGGDIALNSAMVYPFGNNGALYSVFLHELGHSLGLADVAVPDSVMFSTFGVYTGLYPDDIAGIQALYGRRGPAASDNSFASARSLTLNSSGAATISGSLNTTTESDYYKVLAPAGSNSLTVSLDARNLSLLIPKVEVYNSAGHLLGVTSMGSAYGSEATIHLTGLVAGQTYTIVATGATSDVFHIGAYHLNVQFGLSHAAATVAAASVITSTAASTINPTAAQPAVRSAPAADVSAPAPQPAAAHTLTHTVQSEDTPSIREPVADDPVISFERQFLTP